MYMSHKSKKTDTYVDQIEITSLRVVSTTFFSPEPTVAYPLFQGNNYMKLSVVGSTRFSVDVIFSASRLSGLLLFNAGNEENSYVFIRMKKAVLNFCFNCGKKRVCTDLAVIQVFICLDGWRRKCG